MTGTDVSVRPRPTSQEVEAIRLALAALGLLEPQPGGPQPVRPPAARP